MVCMLFYCVENMKVVIVQMKLLFVGSETVTDDILEIIRDVFACLYFFSLGAGARVLERNNGP